MGAKFKHEGSNLRDENNEFGEEYWNFAESYSAPVGSTEIEHAGVLVLSGEVPASKEDIEDILG